MFDMLLVGAGMVAALFPILMLTRPVPENDPFYV